MTRSSNEQRSDAHQHQSHANHEVIANQSNHDRQVSENKN
jgi:hypothetical protein